MYLQAFLCPGRDAVVLLVVLLQEAAPLDILRLGDVGLELGQLRQLEFLGHLLGHTGSTPSTAVEQQKHQN